MLCVRSGDSTLGHVCRLTDLRHQIQTRGPTGVKSHQIGVPTPPATVGTPRAAARLGNVVVVGIGRAAARRLGNGVSGVSVLATRSPGLRKPAVVVAAAAAVTAVAAAAAASANSGGRRPRRIRSSRPGRQRSPNLQPNQ